MPFVSEEELEEELSVFGVEFNNPQIQISYLIV
jgi:hypothetical protein